MMLFPLVACVIVVGVIDDWCNHYCIIIVQSYCMAVINAKNAKQQNEMYLRKAMEVYLPPNKYYHHS